MDNRRLLIAMAVSIAIILGWSFFAEQMGWYVKPKPPVQTGQTDQAGTEGARQAQPGQSAVPGTAQNDGQAGTQAGSSATPADSRQASHAPAEGRDITINTPLYTAVLYSGGGLLRSFELKNYKTSIDPGAPGVAMVGPEAAKDSPLGFLLNGIASWTAGTWSVENGGDINLEDGQTGSLTLKGEMDGMTVMRTFTFNADTYTIQEKTEVMSPMQRALTFGYTMKTGALISPDESNNVTRIAHLEGGSFKEKTDQGDLEKSLSYQGDIGWGGIMSNYFLAVVSLNDPSVNMRASLAGGVYKVVMEKAGLQAGPGANASYAASYYLGPKEVNALAKAPAGVEKALDYGTFSILAIPMVHLLKFFYSFAGNYGVAIILLTVVIKAILWPLSHKSYKSMEKMKKLQPQMAALREKFKDDKERMNKEVMQLYKTYGVNPLGGCLPLLVQLPIFFALYQALLNAIELRQAPFISHVPFTDITWLADLSLKDPFYITPVIMGLSMLLQQKMTPSTGDPTQAKIMMLMPVIFTVMFASFPSGLVVYWLVNNIISIAQQGWILRNKS